ncbi:phosphotransferase [Paenibacillus sp. YPG26]|uniref:phosphotransferase n=1 Tax=Paenibacillus sp. YPG26 TaxID=2878915 RepID=UPI0020411415|nr:phosphotransferase [Paenibacillus sp. YPG26]USB33105.1 aminoglycoside phosphotransferase family protein [Paenibacillus sp. YPG26]
MQLWPIVETGYGIRIRRATRVKDVYKIETGHAVYCLKAYDFPEEEVRFITRVLSCLDEHQFTRSQKVYPTVDQAAYLSHEGTYYTLTNWVHGQQPKFARTSDLRRGIATLAKFHLLATGFPALEAPESRIRYSRLPGELSDYKNLLLPHPRTNHLVEQCDEALELLQQPKVLEAVQQEQVNGAFIHGDYNYPNLVKDRKNTIHLIDFENTSMHVRTKDLAHILHRNCLWNAAGMLRLIEYYQRYRPMGTSELRLLLALLTAPYHVVRNLRIGGLRSAGPIIPSPGLLRRYQRELRAWL